MNLKIKMLVMLLVFGLIISSCNLLRRPALPEEGNQPNQPQQSNDPRQPPPSRGSALEQELASEISVRTEELSGVDNASAIVLGNLALIGLELRDGLDHEHVKELVSQDIQDNFDEIDDVLVTSDPELMDQIAATADKIAQGRPTQEVFDEIYEIWDRMRPQ